ncbi:carboxylesterase [Listeria fleischmannii FSL S10-1203]|uniref:Carboxylesterase n=1 Tax=Listeria fleischmannii FSL S10-1203 TaxID=1265822 RepID=W7DM77_9LIST|nr:carboxylesterase [Listeria fleischmannii FSL S10-1203]
MKFTPPKPFLFETGKRAVLLLHGFTGSSADVRMLGRFLQDHEYTCYAPQYKGHGVSPDLLLQTGPSDWWQDVLEAYAYLEELGYKEIAVAGLSLGALFSLKLGFTKPVKGIVSMSAPTKMDSSSPIISGYMDYVRNYKRLEGKTPSEIDSDMVHYKEESMDQIVQLKDEINTVAGEVDMIYAPIFIAQGKLDDMVDVDGAQWIYDTVESTDKSLKWYENSGHVITIDKERKELQNDILDFFKPFRLARIKIKEG